MKRCINVDSVNGLCERKVEIKEELASQPMGNLLHHFLHCGSPDPINTSTSALCGIFLQNTPAVSILSPPTAALAHNTESHSQKMSGRLPFFCEAAPHKRWTDDRRTLLKKTTTENLPHSDDDCHWRPWPVSDLLDAVARRLCATPGAPDAFGAQMSQLGGDICTVMGSSWCMMLF